ncbi:MAG TPA: hypothetical protein VFI28_10150 [Candidatus Limnocylindrales bacterium]|nr:hypothetical protein [Candidatus Limnocylindrales bacterium]
MDDRTKAAWAATAAVAAGGLWLLFGSGPRPETVVVAIVAAAATFLALEAASSFPRRRR